jgi:5S rRNA maturation endonuclease (ribonuclease M5)
VIEKETSRAHGPADPLVPSDSTVGASNGAGKYQSTDDHTAASTDSCIYDYVDELGRLLFQVIRQPGKVFTQRQPVNAVKVEWADNEWKVDRWVKNLDGVRRVIYRLPEVLDAVRQGKTVWIAEGEKDADSLVAAGVTATCNPGGALKWQYDYSKVFRYADVVIVRDRDDIGHKHASKVADSLRGIASSIKIVEAAEGKDATEPRLTR